MVANKIKFKTNSWRLVSGLAAAVAATFALAVPAVKSQNTQTIKIDGSSTVFPITEAVAEDFQNANRGVRVTVGISGTGGGFKKFCAGEIDIVDASRPIKEEEIAACKSKGISYAPVQVGMDALTIVVNPQNSAVNSITIAQLKKMWEPAAQGTIKKWNQVNPSWPDAPLTLYGPGADSGTFDYFTEIINGKAKESRGDYTASEDDNVLVQGVAGDKFGLGFFGLAYFEENADKLKLIAVDGGEGPVAPSIETVSNGTYSPLSRPLFIYVNSTAAKKKETTKFVEFYLQNAPVLCEEVGYVPLPETEYVSYYFVNII